MSGEEDPPKTALLAFQARMGTDLVISLSSQTIKNWSIRNWKTFTVFYNPPPCGQARLPFGQLPLLCPLPNQPVPHINQHGKLPEHWERKPATQMRVGNYAVSNDAGEALDFSITSFPGEVGGILANVNRWLGQVGIAQRMSRDSPNT
jgi:hypothetical protein